MDNPLGSPLRRKEDQRLITGRGRYVDDLRFPGMLHAAFVRSPHAHARVRSIDAAAARAMAARGGGLHRARSARVRAAHPAARSRRPPAFRRDRSAGVRGPAGALRGRGGGGGGGRGCLRGRRRRGGGRGGLRAPARRRAPWSARSSRARRGCSTPGRTTWPGLSTARVGDPAAGFAGADVVVEARLGIGPGARRRRSRPRGIVAIARGARTAASRCGRRARAPTGSAACIAGAFGLAEEQVRVVVRGHRRWLRHQGPRLLRGPDRGRGRAAARAAGEVGGVAARALPHRLARSRAAARGAPRGRREGRITAIETRVHPRARRLSRERRGGDAQHHQPPAGAVSRSEHRGHRVQRGHPHGLRRRVSRLGPARGRLRARAAHRSAAPARSASIRRSSAGAT